jgi:hypothetical protein
MLETDGHLYLQHAFNTAIAPDKYYFRKWSKIRPRFTLIFNGKPWFWKICEIDWKSRKRDRVSIFIVKDIVHNKSGVYEVEL